MGHHNGVVISHFNINGFSNGGMFAGVEQIMNTQRRMLEYEGILVKYLVGKTDHSDPEKESIIVYPEIDSGRHLWKNGDTLVEEEIVESMVRTILQIKGNKSIIGHNTTNAAGHNPAFGVAFSKVMEISTRDGLPAVMWVHDARKATLSQLAKFIPQVDGATLACVSRVREVQLKEILSRIHNELDIQLPELNILTIPNPIDPIFFNPNFNIPHTIDELAPNFDSFSTEWQSKLTKSEIEKIIFEKNGETQIFILPARLVIQKNIQYAIQILQEYSKQVHQRVMLILTGIPDTRKAENIKYWQDIQTLLKNNASLNNNFDVVCMGGVAWENMPWLYKQVDALFMPAKQEGFGLTPVEGAVCGLPVIITTSGLYHSWII